MFPYSFGVQAPTAAEAKRDLADQIAQLQENHPEDFQVHGAHVKAAQESAEALTALLPPDDEHTDVAISVHGKLTPQKNEDPDKPDDVRNAEFHAYAGRVARDPSKHSKKTKKT